MIPDAAVRAAADIIRSVDYPDYAPDPDLARRVLEAAAEAALIHGHEHLEALPLESVVIDADGSVYEKGMSEPEGCQWDVPGWNRSVWTSDIELPAKVVHIGGQT